MSKKRRTKDLKEHEVAAMVNELTHVAKEFGQMQACREQIRHIVLNHLEFYSGRGK